MIVDASDQVLGRLASAVAKRLLDGDAVEVVNAGNAIITGRPEDVYEKYSKRKDSGDPHHGPYYPKDSTEILRRAIRGMLPMDKSGGKDAFRRLEVHSNNPGDKEGDKISKDKSGLTTSYITLEELSKKLGG